MNRRGPFPGMDPWLERRWGDIQHSLIGFARDSLNDQLPEDLIARIDERIYVGYIDGGARQIIPDVSVLEMRSSQRTEPREGTMGRGGVAVALVDEPIVFSLKDDLPAEGFIEIVEAKGNQKIITAIEVFSPTNKLQSGPRRDYLQKRREYHRAGVSVLEIDLLRQGRHLIDIPLTAISGALQTTYKVCVRRGWRRMAQEAEYYPIFLRSRLPRIRVPLRPTDSDATLDLQSLLDDAYVRGRYDRTDYTQLPFPPLNDEDMTWALQQIKQWQTNAPTVARP